MLQFIPSQLRLSVQARRVNFERRAPRTLFALLGQHGVSPNFPFWAYTASPTLAVDRSSPAGSSLVAVNLGSAPAVAAAMRTQAR